jgi:hypothetical protein
MRIFKLFFRWLFSPWNIILVLVLLGVLGVRYLQTRPTALAIDPKLLQPEDRTRSRLQLELYFVTPDGKSFAVEKRDAGLELDDLGTRASVTMRNYLAGPTLEGAISLIKNLPAPTIFADKNTVYVDVKVAWQAVQLGTQGELLLYCGITNSMLKLEGVQNVKFLLAGQPVPSIGGHIPTDKAFTAKECVP